MRVRGSLRVWRELDRTKFRVFTGKAWWGFNQALWGWTLARQGQPEEGRTQTQEGLALMRATAHAVFYPWEGLTRLAEAYGQAEQPAAALRVVAEALTVVDRTEEGPNPTLMSPAAKSPRVAVSSISAKQGPQFMRP